MRSPPSDLDYRKANAVLRRAALNTVMGGVVGGLLLVGLAVGVILKAGTWRVGWPFWLCSTALLTLVIAWSTTKYRQLARLRVTEDGFELHEATGRTLVPWHAIQEIEIGQRGVRIRTAGHSFAVNLVGAPDPQPFLDVISAKKPAGVRLTI